METPASLVEGGVRRYGVFAARPGSVNPLEEFTGIRRSLRTLRLKEWLGFTLVHPDWYSSLIMQDAHYLASSEIYAYDRATHALHQHAANARGGSLALPARLAGSCSFGRPGYQLQYDFSGPDGRHRLRMDIGAGRGSTAFRGELVLDASLASAPLSVSSRLPGGRMYTHKTIFPAAGVLEIGDDKVVFDGARDMAILDEHKSLFPYRTTWLWGTFALRAGGTIAGANFADRPAVAGEPEESCIWAAGTCEPLTHVRFEPASAQPLAPWRITSRDRRLEVTFEPEGRKQVRHQLGLFAIDYFQLFGHYQGTIRGSGQAVAVDGVHGVCESMRARL